MSRATATRSDHELQNAVQEELEWTPGVDAAGIGVAVDDGTVTLSGEVRTYAQGLRAKRAIQRVRGVTAIVDDITVHPRTAWPATATDIAKETVRALSAASDVPETVKAEVEAHRVVLTGEVQWQYERQAAERAVQYLRGVHSLDNRITLRARPSAADTAERIRQAIARNAVLDARTIYVTSTANRVTLSGTVKSWAEWRQASRAAWASPHVTQVDNNIKVAY